MSKSTETKQSRFVRLAVTTALATTALTACTGKVAPSANYSAAKAETALEKGKSTKAIQHAEAAVLATPRDAYARTLLGNSYLEAGRFKSAEATFGEAILLGDTAPRTIISYALSQIANGDQAGALATLEKWEASLDPADFGLAVSLAGRPDQGVHVLGNALRSGQATAKVRQNLAYAFALQGNWRAARLMVAEDVPADQVGDRLAFWGATIHPEAYTVRVANVLGVIISEDPGQPAMLALSNHPSVDQLASENAEQFAVADDSQPDTVSNFALASQLPAADQPAAEESVAVFEPAVDEGDVALAEASLAQASGSDRYRSNAVVQDIPVSKPAPAKPKAKAAPARQPAAPSPVLALQEGDYNIQLGSFFSMSDAQAAWKIFQARYPELKDAEKSITKARVNGKIYYRVAAVGYAESSARAMCSSVKSTGEGCIAYAASNPLPGALDTNVRVAAR